MHTKKKKQLKIVTQKEHSRPCREKVYYQTKHVSLVSFEFNQFHCIRAVGKVAAQSEETFFSL